MSASGTKPESSSDFLLFPRVPGMFRRVEAIKLNLRCTSCPDGELMVLDQYVYCTVCDPRPESRSTSFGVGVSPSHSASADASSRPAPASR